MMDRRLAVCKVWVALPGEEGECEAQDADQCEEEEEKAPVGHCAGGSHGGLYGWRNVYYFRMRT